jgi:hypothetical protein
MMRKKGPKVRSYPGVDTFKGMVSPGVVQILAKNRRCGYNRLKVVQSIVPQAGYGLFLDQPVMKAGGLITWTVDVAWTSEHHCTAVPAC